MFKFRSKLWLYPGDAAWYFVTLPEAMSDEIEHRMAHKKRGFGSHRVKVTVGTTTWATSIFPDSKARAYLLPIKKAVRTAEGLALGATVNVALDLVELDT